MISLQILDNRTSVISYFSNVVQGIAVSHMANYMAVAKVSQQFGVLFYLPLYFQGVKSYSPIISGVGLVSTTSKLKLKCTAYRTSRFLSVLGLVLHRL